MNRIFLSVLVVLLLNVSFTLAQPQKPVSFFQLAEKFFQTYVEQDRVNYDRLQNEPQQLLLLSGLMQDMNPDDLLPDHQKAFWINAYNIFVIKAVLDHYPIASPMDVSGFFDITNLTVGGKKYSLNDIENKVIRPTYNDARIHFVLVCGAVSCPPIINEAYMPEKLEEQLDRQTRSAINDPEFIRDDPSNKKVLISEIFKWYKVDFEGDGEVLDYINSYRESPVPSDYSVGYYTYDWSLNGVKKSEENDGEGQHGFDPLPDKVKKGEKEKKKETSNVKEYTPSKLLKKGQVDMQLFNNIYSQTAYRDLDGKKIDLNSRATYYTGIFNFLYGISPNSKINVGLDVNLKAVEIDPRPESSPFSILRFENSNLARVAIGSIGPKIKLNPVPSLSGFSLQSAFWITVASDPEGLKNNKPWLDYDRFTWWNQFFYDKALSDQFQLFTEADLLFRFEKDFEMKNTQLVTPVSAFVNYFPTIKSTLYAMVQYAPTLTETSTWYSQAGIGAKYQISRVFNLEVSYTNFFASSNAGAGETFNLGIRYLR
jgi:hypothetical protein